MFPFDGQQYLLEYHMLVLIEQLNFPFEFEARNWPGFEPRSPGLKAARLTVELNSNDCQT